MLRWRLTLGLLLLVVVGLPLAVPLAGLLAEPLAWRSWAEAGRLLTLARNTSLLVAGTLLLALPLGTLLAWLLYRTNLPGQRLLRFLVLLTLFVPLPLFASGWQAVLGSGGLLPNPFWNPQRDAEVAGAGLVWTPWGQGLVSAIWVQALASLPWVVLLVGQGLCWVEPELEEDALTATGRWRVLTRVTLPRSRAALAAVALWVALQAGTEITVTDLMQVRTFAEEVYTQIVAPDPSAIGPGGSVAHGESRALAVTLPVALATALLVLLLARHWERTLPPRATLTIPSLVYPLGRGRWPGAVLVFLTLGLLQGLPLVSLVWRAGWQTHPPTWSLLRLYRELLLVARADWHLLLGSLTAAATAGILATGLALAACWAALDRGWFRTGVLVLMALAWAFPGPVIGLGLKAVLRFLVDATDSDLVASLLWHGPSLVPLIWADVIRFFPCAVVLLWPVVRLVPAELREAARLDGARLWQELVWVIWPLTSRACLRSAVAVGVLSLGELSAGKMVSTPDQQSYAEWIFAQMHYGVTADLAARCLLLLLLVALGAAALGVVGRTTQASGGR